MFAACPHCQFLVAQHPQTRAWPPVCPRCGRAIADEGVDAPVPPPSLAAYLHPADGVEQADGAAVQARDTRDGSSGTDAVADGGIADPVGGDAVDAVDAHDAVHAVEAQATPQAREEETDAAADAIPTAAAPGGPAAPSAAVAPVRARAAATPRFTRAPRTTTVHARAARWQWGALAGLSLLLCLQVILADRDRLAAQAAWRPVVSALCGAFACDVPTWREPAAFAMLSRDVRPIPGAPGTLQAQATFRNDARWTQAWPVILLTLKDADGRTLGARALQPQDYLAGAEPQAGIAPGQSAQVAVRVREPSANVVAFSFDFR
ncbi:DUF3426 domain-containing protein [Pseudoxanthomonas putridarboris]|uniref:DUF3426 domain-containing protein n=1 Tax=Pseudoxanthomonas putridarboris TaxID=752605 RepID=A0ABU9J2L1_9GAMM